MLCRICGCPSFAPLLTGGICFNSSCTYYDTQALHKAVYDDSGNVNGDPLEWLNAFLAPLPD